jgi:hypothetical protein
VKRFLGGTRRLLGSGLGRSAVAVGVVGTTLLAVSGQAFAACVPGPEVFCGNGGDVVDGGFGTLATTLLGYLGDAIGLVLVVLGLGLGIRALVKWARVALRST